MSFYKTVKQNAKRALAGGWGKAIGLMLIAALPLSLVRILEQVIRSMGGIPAYVDYRGTPWRLMIWRTSRSLRYCSPC